jgi:hypothetical protein
MRVNLKSVVCEGVDWINLAHDIIQWRVLIGMLVNLQILLTVTNLMTS